MTSREADEVLVVDNPRHAGRVDITVVHGRYETALNMSVGELVRLRSAIDAHLSATPNESEPSRPIIQAFAGDEYDELRRTGALSTPPADDVREAVARLSNHVFHGEYFKRTATVVEVSDLRLVLDALIAAEVRPHGALTDTEALAKAWDDGVRTAGAYGHEDTWTHDMTPYDHNPYRGEVCS